MRIALAQINPTIGDIVGNLKKHLEAVKQAREEGAEVVLFPEMSILGYPPKDLLLKPAAIQLSADAVERVAEAARGITALVGYGGVEQGAGGVCGDEHGVGGKAAAQRGGGGARRAAGGEAV